MAIPIPVHVIDDLVARGLASSGGSESYYRNRLSAAVAAGKYELKSKGNDDMSQSKIDALWNKAAGGPSYNDIAAGAGGAGDGIRVKAPSEMYRSDRVVAKHATLGTPVAGFDGQNIESTTQLDHAKLGTLVKFLASRSGVGCSLNEHERGLLAEMAQKDTWSGRVDGQYCESIPALRVKAILDDATSGGLEISPEWFDSRVVTTPVLHSEILPYVDRQPIPRGSRVAGASIGNPTISWGTAEGTQIGLLDTDALVAAIDTTIYPVSGAVEIGRDFLSDSAVDIGRVIADQYGQKLLAELDNVLAAGNGTNRPEGVLTASGVSTVPATSGPGGVVVMSDLLNCLFGIAKEYRTGRNCRFLMSDELYCRVRSIRVDSTSDQRLVLGPDTDNTSGNSIERYSILGRGVSVNNSIANSVMAFVDWSRYRLYSRPGVDIRVITEDSVLAKANTQLIVFRSRWGGRLLQSAAAVKITDLAV